jgi:hypothetical protein
MKLRRFLLVVLLGTGFASVLLWLLVQHAKPVVAAPGDVMTVCKGGGCDYDNVQAAVDAATGGEVIKVAGDTYTDVTPRAAPGGYTGSSVVTQVVYIDKAVTIRGGYTTLDNFADSNPLWYPTTLDAEGQGRVLFVAGDVSPVIEGLRLTGGDAGGMGGYQLGPNNYDAGGGVYVTDAEMSLSDSQVFSNTAEDGGGVFLDNSASMLNGLSIISNTVTREGGGVFVRNSPAILGNSTVSWNTAQGAGWSDGGGAHVEGSDATFSGNTFAHNTTVQSGGGIFVQSSNIVLDGNTIAHNESTMSNGGGVFVSGGGITMTGNVVVSNSARYEGGGISLRFSDDARLNANTLAFNDCGRYGGGLHVRVSTVTMTNNAIVDNIADGAGSGLYLEGADIYLFHTTIARNTGGDETGVYVTDRVQGSKLYVSTVGLINTVLVSHTVGITVTGGNTASLNSVLWHNTAVTTSHSPTATLTVQNEYYGDPLFVADGYHLTAGSPARDGAVDVGVVDDIDGDSRLFGAPPDLGADEFVCFVRLNDTPYTTIQDAIDASISSADVVKVAGTCYGVETRDAKQQVAYITKTLTLRGGYDASFSVWDPDAYPATLDALGQGRVVYILGDIGPVVEQVRLTGGKIAGPGGGIFAQDAHPVISGCHVYSNTSSSNGGGIYIWSGDHASLIYNQVYSNASVSGGGGGIYVSNNDYAELYGNRVFRNTSLNSGGGMALMYSSFMLHVSAGNNYVAENVATSGSAGGVYLYADGSQSMFALSGNTVVSNTAGQDGGGLYLYLGDVIFEGDTFVGNRATWRGGGMYLYGDEVTSVNTVVAGNQAGWMGAGLYIDNALAHLMHTTIARNQGGDGSGIYVAGTAYLTNTILVSHTVGITVATGQAQLEATLWGSNDTDWGGSGVVVTGTPGNNYWGDPAFVDPSGMDYHIGPGSAAINRAVSTVLDIDIDDDPRPFGPLPDLGADEYVGRVYLPLVLREYP